MYLIKHATKDVAELNYLSATARFESKLKALAPMPVFTTEQLAAFLARLEAAHAAKLLTDEEFFSLEVRLFFFFAQNHKLLLLGVGCLDRPSFLAVVFLLMGLSQRTFTCWAGHLCGCDRARGVRGRADGRDRADKPDRGEGAQSHRSFGKDRSRHWVGAAASAQVCVVGRCIV